MVTPVEEANQRDSLHYSLLPAYDLTSYFRLPLP